MKKNIGTSGRLFRLFIAIGLLILAYLKASWILFIAGLFVLYESAAGWCIVYACLGKHSCQK